MEVFAPSGHHFPVALLPAAADSSSRRESCKLHHQRASVAALTLFPDAPLGHISNQPNALWPIPQRLFRASERLCMLPRDVIRRANGWENFKILFI
jgi:hypothetical protein